MQTMTVEEIADIFLHAVGLEHGFIQPCYELDLHDGPKAGGTEPEQYNKRQNTYRVVAYGKGKMGDITSPNLLEAIEDSLDRAGIQMPPQLTELRSRDAYVAAGVAEVYRERRHHGGYVPSVAWLAERLRLDPKKADKILPDVITKTTPREKEKK